MAESTTAERRPSSTVTLDREAGPGGALAQAARRASNIKAISRCVKAARFICGYKLVSREWNFPLLPALCRSFILLGSLSKKNPWGEGLRLSGRWRGTRPGPRRLDLGHVTSSFISTTLSEHLIRFSLQLIHLMHIFHCIHVDVVLFLGVSR